MTERRRGLNPPDSLMPTFERSDIITLPINRVIPYSKNPRKNEDTIPVLMQSIEDFGFNVPIIIDSENFVVAGHARLEAAKRLKMEEVPCIRVTDLSAEQIKAFRLADNKTAEAAKWNENLLKMEMKSIKSIDFKPFGFKPLEFTGYEEDKSKEGKLANDFIIPPMSVIKSYSKECTAIDEKWKSKLIGSPDYPPHLAEILFRWFTPEGGAILSPFVKSDYKKSIAHQLGFKYFETVPESAEKVDMLHIDLFKGAEPSTSISEFTFREIEKALNCLSDNRFVVAGVQEFNDSTYGCRTCRASELEKFLASKGYRYYNELIYVMKSPKELDDKKEQFLRTRIVQRAHLTVMVFYKGAVKEIRNNFPPILGNV